MNIFALGSIDYFSISGLPFVLLSAWGIWIFQPIVTLLHELGHATVAYFSNGNEIRITVGEQGKGGGLKPFKISERITCILYFRNARVGYTNFIADSRWHRLLILLGGPFITAVITLCTANFLFFKTHNHWVEVVLISWFCGNFLTLVRSIIPMKLKPTQAFPQGSQSDGLQILKILLSHHTLSSAKE